LSRFSTAFTPKLYVGGGYDNETFDAVDEVEIFDGATGEKTTDVLSQTRSGVRSIAAGGRVFFAEVPSSTSETVVPRLEVMPNPALDELTINLPSNSADLELRLYNLMGRVVHSTAAQSTINLQGLPQGMYLLQLEKNGVAVSRTKLLKQ
jgi:hypothetical protein